jgi:hypothetical protein
MKLVMIEWIDSHSRTGMRWEDLDGLKEDWDSPLRCHSVGWLLKDTKTMKVLVPHVSCLKDEKAVKSGIGAMSIPTKAVVKMTVLRKRV